MTKFRSKTMLMRSNAYYVNGRSYFVKQDQEFEVKVPEDIEYFRKDPTTWEEVSLGKKIKEKVSPKSFDYNKWLLTELPDNVVPAVKKKYPTLKDLKTATKEDLKKINGIGSVTAATIVKLAKEAG